MNINTEKLYELKKRGFLSNDQYLIVLKESEIGEKSIYQIIIDFGFISEKALISILIDKDDFEDISLSKTVLDLDLIQKLPRKIAEQFNVIPISRSNNQLKLATANVNDIKSRDSVKKYFPDVKIIPILIPQNEIQNAINHYYNANLSPSNILKEIEQNKDEVQIQSPIIRFVESILTDAVKKNASDIHIEPSKFFIKIKYRVDGILMQSCIFHKNYWQPLCVRIKILANMNISDSIKPQKGSFSLYVLGKNIDFRVSSHPILEGENIVIRVLEKQKQFIDLDGLGYSDLNKEIIRRNIKKPDGMIIVTGPTGSGKTTSLYSMIMEMNLEEKNIMTLEDPVEYRINSIKQSNLYSSSNFNDNLKSLLRQDPDVILIGEIRDADTANTAVRASMTGHLILTTLHTQDAFGAISRFIDFGVSPSILAENLSCIVAQRLVRKPCVFCRDNEAIQDRQNNIGCNKCHFTGYRGRFCISEVLEIDEDIKNLIGSGCDMRLIKKEAVKKGFVDLVKNAKENVLSKHTTISEIRRSVTL